MDHFMVCESYGDIPREKYWKIMLEDNVDKQYEIAKVIKMRHKMRQDKIEKYEAGQVDDSGSGAPGNR